MTKIKKHIADLPKGNVVIKSNNTAAFYYHPEDMGRHNLVYETSDGRFRSVPMRSRSEPNFDMKSMAAKCAIADGGVAVDIFSVLEI